jgi:hypothetical protein
VANRPLRSEALEATYRRLFPAQAGNEVTTDLLGSDTIVPVIDMTPSAEGTQLATPLQQALDFTSNSQIFGNTTVTLQSTPGFYLVRVNCFIDPSIATVLGTIFIDDGVSQTAVYTPGTTPGTGASLTEYLNPPPFVVFLRPGDTLKGGTTAASMVFSVVSRQIADLYGNLTNPLGFQFQ